jgi:hypothetical protein
MKTAELLGADLDYWVAKIDPQCIGCEIVKAPDDHPLGAHYIGRTDDGVAFFIPTKGIAQILRLKSKYGSPDYRPHIAWHQGGPIIERELIELTHDRDWREDGQFGRVWQANACFGWWDGDTPLIAAMRAFIASKFGDEVQD